MKKKILSSLAVVAIAAIASFNLNFNTQDNNLSDISLANVEALAKQESILDSYIWIVTIYSPWSWNCNPGGGINCPY